MKCKQLDNISFLLHSQSRVAIYASENWMNFSSSSFKWTTFLNVQINIILIKEIYTYFSSNLPGELLMTFLKASSAIPILSKRSLCPPVLLVSISEDVNAINECKYCKKNRINDRWCFPCEKCIYEDNNVWDMKNIRYS